MKKLPNQTVREFFQQRVYILLPQRTPHAWPFLMKNSSLARMIL